MPRNIQAVLGVFFTDTSVEGVLMRKDEGNKIQVVERFVRHRARRGETVLSAKSLLPGLKDRSESDYTLETGDGSQKATDLFLPREFGGAGSDTNVAEKVRADTASKKTTPFGSQLREILSDCRDAGYPAPSLAFCIGSSEVIYHEIGLKQTATETEEASRTGKFKLSREELKSLVARVEETVQGDVDKRRIAFLPMVREPARERYLAVVPATPDPMAAALDMVARSSKQFTPTAYIADSEISLLVSLVRRRQVASAGVTAVVRVSANDTIALFLKNGVLHKYEHLRSLTSYDALDTVCSRVVLKQDELRIGSVDQLYVSTEHQGVSAISTFETFFPEAKVFDLKELLNDLGMTGAKAAELRAASVPAAGVALRLVNGWDQADKEFPSVNLLDRKRRGQTTRRQAIYAWHSTALMALLFATTLFFTWRYMTNREVIQQRSEEIRVNPPQFPTQNAAVLSARVDSLQRAYQNYTRALAVLDSLLLGSDKWSRTLDRMTRSTGSIGSVWLKAWTPQPGALRLEGNALQRSRIAALAQQWEGSIETLNFAEIQGLRVYTYIMNVPVASQIPEVALYLRQQSIEELEPAEAEALTATGGVSGTLTNTN